MSAPDTPTTTGAAGGPARTEVPLAVLGAGPAGVAATIAAARAGVEVLLLDAAERPGGQYHRREPRAFVARRPGALHHGFAPWQRTLAELDGLVARGRVRLAPGVSVWAATSVEGGSALATDDPALGTVVARALVIATGAHERVVPFPGWDLPGVITVGGAQALLKGHGVRPGHAVVVAGAGPLLLPVAAALAASGTHLVAVADAGDPRRWLAGGVRGVPLGKIIEGAGHLARIARHGSLVRPRTAAIAARGDGRVEGVVLARVDTDWRAIAGTERTVGADALVTSHGFAPTIDVAIALGCTLTGGVVPHVRVDDDQASDVAGVHAAGEVTGIAGADVGELEGTVAGLAAARHLGAPVAEADIARARARRRRRDRFVATLAGVLEVPAGALTWAAPSTIVCRCEEVTRATVEAAIDERGARDLRSVKLTTRCGMGRCQGRMCAPAVAAILEGATGHAPTDAGELSRRPILTPVPLGRLHP